MKELKENKPIAKQRKDLEKMASKTSLLVFGSNDELEKDSDRITKLVRDTRKQTALKFGSRTEGKLVDHYSEVSLRNFIVKDEEGETNEKGTEEKPLDIKSYLEDSGVSRQISGLLSSEEKNLEYRNYSTMYANIPELAQSLDLVKDSVLSPDDFTKAIFDVYYDEEKIAGNDFVDKINENLELLTNKYDLEILSDEIVTTALMYGNAYVSVLSLNDELENLLTDPLVGQGAILTEQSIRMTDIDLIDVQLNSSDLASLTTQEIGVLAELFDIGTERPSEEEEIKMITEEEQYEKVETPVKEKLLELFNQNVIISSKKEQLVEIAEVLREEYSQSELQDMFNNSKDTINNRNKQDKKDKKSKVIDKEPLFINGSAINIIDPSEVIELKINNTIYGYYHFEGGDGSALSYVSDGNISLSGPTDHVMFKRPISAGVAGNTHFSKDIDGMTNSQKEKLVAKIFTDMLSKKLNKQFVRNNKELADYIYNLVKNGYITHRPVKVTYYDPQDMISFKVPALFRKVTFFARLYMAVLTNTLLVKMGRAHDMRVFYIEAGADNDYENTTQEFIRNIKTKEFAMDSISGDINNILRLNPGRFNDFFFPLIDGEKNILIDTIAGMDSNINNEFLEYLKDSMLSGIGVPRSYIDNLRDVDFARTLAVQNSNFSRMIVKYQKLLQGPFTKLYRQLYINEFKYYNDQENYSFSDVDVNKIRAVFPSPVALNQTNLSEQIEVAVQNANTIARHLVDETEKDAETLTHKLRAKIMEDFIPGIDWSVYHDYLDEVRLEVNRSKLSEGKNDEDEDNTFNPY